MSASKIEWTEVTWNPTTGCDRISPGCDSCYAMTMAKRLKAMGSAKYQNDGDPRTSGPGFAVTMHDEVALEPLVKWPRKGRVVFLDSMSDVFHARVETRFLGRIFATMALTPQHTYQVLTKRPSRMRDLLAVDGRVHRAMVDALFDLRSVLGAAPNPLRRTVDSLQQRIAATTDPAAQRSLQLALNSAAAAESKFFPDQHRGTRGPELSDWVASRLVELTDGECPWPLPNVWLGTSIENDEYVSRADDLRETPAAIRFLSLEPLLGALPSLDLTGIDWVIAGGESGHQARIPHPDWFRDIRDRCVSANVAFHFKQWGEWVPGFSHDQGNEGPGDRFVNPDGSTGRVWIDEEGIVKDCCDAWGEDSQPMSRRGKKRAGRLLDGRYWDEFPKPAEGRHSA